MDESVSKYKEHGRLANGVDSEAAASSPPSSLRDPKNLYGLIWRFVDRYGVLALVCLGMAYYVWFITRSHSDAAKLAHVEFQAAMREQTAAVKESTIEQRKMTEALIKMDGRLDAHMKADDAERRRR